MYAKQLENAFVLDAIFSLEFGGVNGEASDGNGPTLKQHHSDLELSNQFALLLSEYGVGVKQIVLETLSNSELSSNFIVE